MADDEFRMTIKFPMTNLGLRRQAERDAALDGCWNSAVVATLCQRSPKEP
jgi:hypothetical protein